MKNILTLMVSVFLNPSISLAVEQEKCFSVGCDQYIELKKKLQADLKKIKCDTGNNVNCNQIESAKIVKNYTEKIGQIFTNVNVSQSIAKDLQFNPTTNLFTQKSQEAPGVYELVPTLVDRNIGVHTGKVVNNQPFVDRAVNIDPKGSDVKASHWFLTQWKKKDPLMLNSERKDPIITNSNWTDGFLGKPLFEVNSPINAKFGTETSLLIYTNPKDGSNVFEIVGRNGYINQYGGSNVFLTGETQNTEHGVFNNDINLTFNGKISRMNMKSFNSKDPDAIAIGSIFTGFTASNSETNDSIFIQISHSDTRKWFSEHRACYMHGDNLEIVYGYNIDDDFNYTADPAGQALRPKKYNLNRYLCAALKGNFNCPKEVNSTHFPKLRGDLSKWKFGGLYTGIETQVARGPVNQPDNPGVNFGEVESAIQYSNMRVSADTNVKFKDCDEVEKFYEGVKMNCYKDSFKNSAGQTVETFCGCGEIKGGVKQDDGCFHKLVTTVTNPAAPVDSKCNKGSFLDGNNKEIEFYCGCGDIPGGVKQDNGCFHKFAPVPFSGACNKGTFTNENGKLVDFFCDCGVIDGAVKQGDGCYHKAR